MVGDDKNPKVIVHSEVVDFPAAHYIYNEFHGINSENFGAYWVGDFAFDVETERQIDIFQSWAQTRLIIDDKIIYGGSDSKTLTYTFSPGSHRIEVEFVNNWHTTGYSFKISQPIDFVV